MAEPRALAAPNDSLEAVRNALKLGASLIVTLAMSFGVRLLLPRYLGPELFGTLKFADSFATGFFVILTLGVEVYIRREVSVRPDHATQFLGGIFVTRLALAGFLFGAMTLVLRSGNRSWEEHQLVYVFGVSQFLVITNVSLAALLQARGQVDGLSWTNLGTKALWGVLIGVTLYWKGGLLGIAAALVCAETIKAAILAALVHRHLGWRASLDMRATWAVLIASLPFYVNSVAHIVYSKMGVSMLAFLAKDVGEVGHYGAASDLAGMTLLVTPLISWVLAPLYSRARHRSDEEFNRALRRSLELILTLGFPVSLLLGLGADVWMRIAFGAGFENGALALRILAPLFLVTYVAMVVSTALVNLQRAWTLTLISLVGLAINPVLNWVFIRFTQDAFGSTLGGAPCALADVGTELVVTGGMLLLVGRRAFDARSVTMLLKTLTVCAGVVVLHETLAGIGPARLAVDAVVYSAGVLATRAVRLDEIVAMVRAALRTGKRESAA